ncbi:MAG: BTAD domain-containing putative transcriptional regulator [Anaerovoracaceae bacterium]
MLGRFTLQYGENCISDQEGRSKKLWLLIEYLVTFRGKEISQNDLIDLLWPDDSHGNPANTLKTLVHRARTMIGSLNYDNAKNIIIYRRGTYAWNDELDMVVDLDVFEHHVQTADQKDISIEQRLSHLTAAIDMYKGDFLPKLEMETWAIPISTYYHSLYIKAVHEAIEILSSIKNWEEIVSICERATEIDPYDEKLHYHLIQALVNSKNQQLAKSHYENVTKMFFEKFGVAPSSEFLALYKQVVRTLHQTEMDLNSIREKLNESEYETGAFYCEFEVFKEIYQLEVRNSSRAGQSIYLGLITITDPEGDVPAPNLLKNAMGKLLLTVNESLRRSDVYTRYSASQYLIMLHTLTVENAEMVVERIVKRFKREYPKLAVKLAQSTLPIEIVI